MLATGMQVVLLDVALESGGGEKALRMLVQEHPDQAVLLVVNECTMRNATLALGSGALGCIARAAPTEEWCKAIDAVGRGELWIPRVILAQIVKRLLLQVPKQASPAEGTEPLTEREREIADYVLGGLSNKEIGMRLEIRDSTVKTHLHRVYAKLGLHRRTQLIGVASRSVSTATAPG